MPSRIFAFVLALVLLCTGFSSPALAEPVVVTDQATAAMAAGEAPERSVDESIDDRLPIDASAQVGAETLADSQQALLMNGAGAPTSPLCMARPRPYAAPSRLAPYLDGPQRPPCADSLVA